MFTVFNETDGIPAWYEDFETEEKAKEFITKFRNRFDHQGYYKTARGERISADDVVLLIHEVDDELPM